MHATALAEAPWADVAVPETNGSGEAAQPSKKKQKKKEKAKVSETGMADPPSGQDKAMALLGFSSDKQQQPKKKQKLKKKN